MTGVQNLPEYAQEYKFIVAREWDNEFWFYGAYNDRNKANWVAEEVDGVVFQNDARA